MVKVKIGKEEIIYSNEDLISMTKSQLEQLNQDLQCNMEEVSAKRARYMAENNEEYGSKEYYKKIAKYKAVMACIKKSIAKVSAYKRNLKEDGLKKTEHWLWCFYTSVKHNSKNKDFEKYLNLTNEKAGYSIDIGE